MNIFNVIVLEPIFNTLLVLYAFIGDFGLSIIVFTILVRIALWPLIKKQLHQTKLMRKVQPELKKIKKKTKGNKQLETQLTMELYRERGVKPFSSIGVLLLQLPIFIAIYQVINIITKHRNDIEQYLYDPTKNLPALSGMLSPDHVFNEKLFNAINLTQTVYSHNTLNVALLLLAIIAAALQFIQTKQLMPQSDSQKKLRDILKEASQGKEADQSEITSVIGSRMALFMPLMLLVFAFYLPGAVVLYYATSSFVAIIQQHLALRQDVEEMNEIASEPMVIKKKETEAVKKGKNGTTVRRLNLAEEAKVVKTTIKKVKKQKKRR